MIAGTSTDVSAQDSRVYVDAGVSHARPPAGVDLDPSTYALLGTRFFAGPAFGSLYGGLALDTNSADWIGGQLGARYQAPRQAKITWGVTGVVSAFSLSEPTPYEAVTARAIPELRLASGQTAIVLRGSGGIGRSDVTDTSQEPAVSYEADLWMIGAGFEASRPFGRTQAWLGAEAYEAGDGFYASAYVGSLGSLAGAVWVAELRLWDTPADFEPAVRISVSVPFTPRWSAEVAFGRSSPDPLLGSPAGADGSAVVSWSVIARSDERPPVVSVSPQEPTSVTFRLEDTGAESVAVIGDFSDWEPIPLTKRGKAWTSVVVIEPGLYHFGFLVDGEWYVPERAPGKVTDEFGRLNATLVVAGQ
ncbi:MAG: glycogen-binding domain-containing protein [Gemmatimonadales bacterium]|jgi:hypothetical protein